MSLWTDVRDFLTGGKEQTQDQTSTKAGSSAQSATTTDTSTTAKTQQESSKTEGSQTQQLSQAVTTDQAVKGTEKVGATSTQQGLSDAVVAQLESLIGGANVSGVQNLQGLATQAGSVAASTPQNTQAILDSIRASGMNRLETEVLPGIQVLGQATGGSAGTNTLVNQLKTQAVNDLLAKMAGAEADVMLRGQDQTLQALNTAAGIETAGLQGVSGLANVLKGAITTGTTEQDTSTNRTLASTQGTESITTALQELVKNMTTDELSQSDALRQLEGFMNESGSTSGTSNMQTQQTLLDWVNSLGSFGPNK